ncbi:MAG: cryptochrome/photolyase family protein [Isosphaeraceae bacterium]
MPSKIAAWILPDQVLEPARHPALVESLRENGGDQKAIRVVLIESRRHFSALPYQKKRLVLYISAMRHYAEELKATGWQVDYLRAETFYDGLKLHREKHGWRNCFAMEALEYPSIKLQKQIVEKSKEVPLHLIDNSQFYWLQTEFKRPVTKNIIMENFYRTMRRHFQLLMEPDGTPAGGEWNYDAENRKPLPKKLDVPDFIAFEPDKITRQVMTDVETDYASHIGETVGFDLPVNREQAAIAFDDFLQNRLAEFGPYEDAMSHKNGRLWHSVMSPVMNLGLIDALAMCRRAEAEFRAGRASVQSVEGFIRQIVGWREYIQWQYARQMPDLRNANGWNHSRATPHFWWSGKTEMNCLKQIVSRLIDSGFNHHIERLMVLCNFAMLAGINPEAVANWFLTMYVDSHDWVVLPNVIGMGLNADGGKTATKPYIASGAYINKMSDFCGHCQFHVKQRSGEGACPFNYLYWNFLVENETKMRSNPRMGPNVLGLKHVSADERKIISQQAKAFLEEMQSYDDPAYQPDDSMD